MKDEMLRAVERLSALAQASRLKIFRLLVEAGRGGLPAGAVGEQLDLAPATLSFHLAQLSQAGLLTAERDGRSIIYRADYAAMDELIRYLTRNCCRGDARRQRRAANA